MKKQIGYLLFLLCLVTSCGIIGIIPSNPSNLLIVSATETSITLAWSACEHAQSYTVDYGTTLAMADGKLNVTDTQCTATGLNPNTTYYFGVTAINTPAESDRSELTGATLPSTQSTAKPSTPSNLTAAVLSPTSVTLSWTETADATGYRIYYGTNTSDLSSSVTCTSNSCTVTDLVSETTYYFAVAAININGESSMSSPVSASTTNATQDSTTPTGLTATVISTTEIDITWNAVSGASGYRIYYGVDSSSTLSKIASDTSFSFTGLSVGTKYYFSVAAIVGTTESAKSSQINASTKTATDPDTPATPDKPTTPSNLSASAKSSSTITLSWTAVTGATSYKLYYGKTSNPTTSKETSTNTYTFEGLAAETKYYFKVSAVNAGGESARSSAVSATTPVALAASPVIDLIDFDKNLTALTISWTAISGAKSYTIYRSSTAGGNYTSVGTSTSSSFTDKSVDLTKANVCYYYRVTATNAAGEGAQSTPKGVKLGNPSVYVEGSIGYVMRITLGSKTYEDITTSSAAKLLDSSVAPGSYILSYKYRKNSSTGTFGSTISLYSEQFSPGIKYTYVIKLTDGSYSMKWESAMTEL